MYNPTENLEPQNPFKGMGKFKNPLEIDKDGDNKDNPFVFKGFKNPFEQDDEYKD